MTYRPTYLPDGRKAYDPRRTGRDIRDEWAALEDKVREEEPGCRYPDMKARELWRQEEAAAERWSEWQERVWKPACRAASLARFEAGETERSVGFTKAELERLVEHFAGANDPVAQSIGQKAGYALQAANV